MTDERFREAAIAQYKKEIVTQVREISTVRRLLPVNPNMKVSDNTYIYYKLKESSKVQYNFEIVAPEYNAYATEKVVEPIPVLQGDLQFSRHERGRLSKDVVPIDIRTRELIADMTEREEKLVFYGGDNVAGGENGLSDVTNNVTTATDELDLGTYLEAIQHFHTSASQLRTLLKNKYNTGPMKIVWTSDVDDRAKAIAHTYNGQSFYDWVVDYLAKHNGSNGVDDIIVTNYLGSATNAATVNTLMMIASPRLVELVVSDIEITQGETPQKDLQLQVNWRIKPVFYLGNDCGIYHTTTVLT